MTPPLRWLAVVATIVPAVVPAQATKVGPPHGAVIVVGGAGRSRVYGAFIKAAGGPDALIAVDVPTAGGSRWVRRTAP